MAVASKEYPSSLFCNISWWRYKADSIFQRSPVLVTTLTWSEELAQAGKHRSKLQYLVLTFGSLITIMLVRLRMTASQALRHYFELGSKIFSKENKKWKGQDGAFKASTLQASVKAIVESSSNGSRMLPIGVDRMRAKG